MTIIPRDDDCVPDGTGHGKDLFNYLCLVVSVSTEECPQYFNKSEILNFVYENGENILPPVWRQGV